MTLLNTNVYCCLILFKVICHVLSFESFKKISRKVTRNLERTLMAILETLQITLSTSQMVFQSRMYTNVGTTLLESVYTLTQIFFSNSRAVRVGTTRVYRKKGGK